MSVDMFSVFIIFQELLLVSVLLGVYLESSEVSLPSYTPPPPDIKQKQKNLLQLSPSLPFVYSIFMEMQHKNKWLCLSL